VQAFRMSLESLNVEDTTKTSRIGHAVGACRAHVASHVGRVPGACRPCGVRQTSWHVGKQGDKQGGKQWGVWGAVHARGMLTPYCRWRLRQREMVDVVGKRHIIVEDKNLQWSSPDVIQRFSRT